MKILENSFRGGIKQLKKHFYAKFANKSLFPQLEREIPRSWVILKTANLTQNIKSALNQSKIRSICNMVRLAKAKILAFSLSKMLTFSHGGAAERIQGGDLLLRFVLAIDRHFSGNTALPMEALTDRVQI